MSRLALAGFTGLMFCSLMVGCGATPALYGDQPQPVTGGTPVNKDPPKPTVAPYPDGPYGNQEGNVFPNLMLSGYRLSPTATDSTQLMWDDTVSMQDYHINSKYKCLVVSLGATWCGACQQEQPALSSDVSADEKFAVLNILQEGPMQQKLATRKDVDDWAQQFHQTFPVVQGTAKTGTLMQGYGSTIGLPFNLIVRTKDMQIVGSVQGFDSGIHEKALGLCGM